MQSTQALLFGALLLAPACAAAERVDTGWSRAPDLSVLGAMNHFGAVAREQQILCWRRSPAEVDRRWRRRFGARHERVTAAMTARHGAEAVERSRLAPGPRVPCPSIIGSEWWSRYERLLRLLELRIAQGSAR